MHVHRSSRSRPLCGCACLHMPDLEIRVATDVRSVAQVAQSTSPRLPSRAERALACCGSIGRPSLTQQRGSPWPTLASHSAASMALRPGSAKAVELWKGGDAAAYAAALGRYGACVRAVGATGTKAVKGLVGLDAWVRKELPKALARDGAITREDIIKVMLWKLGRGKFRPLMSRLEGNSAVSVETNSRVAFKATTDKGKVEALCRLSAVGPATASAVLEAHNGNSFAFLADEAIDATGIGREYTLKKYLEFNRLMRAKARELGDDWTPALVSRALWARAKADVHGLESQPAADKRRKAVAAPTAAARSGKRAKTK